MVFEVASLPDSTTPAPHKPRVRWRNVAIALATIFGLFVFCCSGLPFPIIGGARSDLNRELQKDFGMTLPASAVVERGARIAYRDPAYYYVVRLPPENVNTLIAAVRAAATAKRISAEDQRIHEPMTLAPEWFKPTQYADIRMFDVRPSELRTWAWSYSASAGKVYVERLEN
jgi:hypothetical protein